MTLSIRLLSQMAQRGFYCNKSAGKSLDYTQISVTGSSLFKNVCMTKADYMIGVTNKVCLLISHTSGGGLILTLLLQYSS